MKEIASASTNGHCGHISRPISVFDVTLSIINWNCIYTHKSNRLAASTQDPRTHMWHFVFGWILTTRAENPSIYKYVSFCICHFQHFPRRSPFHFAAVRTAFVHFACRHIMTRIWVLLSWFNQFCCRCRCRRCCCCIAFWRSIAQIKYRLGFQFSESFPLRSIDWYAMHWFIHFDYWIKAIYFISSLTSIESEMWRFRLVHLAIWCVFFLLLHFLCTQCALSCRLFNGSPTKSIHFHWNWNLAVVMQCYVQLLRKFLGFDWGPILPLRGEEEGE